MPLALIWVFVTAAIPVVKMVLKALGIGVVSYVGINLVLSQATDVILQNFLSLPASIQQIMGILKVDVAVNIVLSAITTKVTLRGIDKLTDTKTRLGGV